MQTLGLLKSMFISQVSQFIDIHLNEKLVCMYIIVD